MEIKMQFRILIVEDNRVLAETLMEFFQDLSYQCSNVQSISEATKAIEKSKPDLCVLDIGLPDGDGISLCKTLRTQGINIPIVFLTGDDSEETLVDAFATGGDDYLVKPFRSKELVARIERLLRKKACNEKEILLTGDLRICIQERKLWKSDIVVGLRPLEWKLLELLLQRDNLLVKRAWILECLWDQYENYVEENTLSVHMSRLRSKLGTYKNHGYWETVWGIGYRWIVPIQRKEVGVNEKEC